MKKAIILAFATIILAASNLFAQDKDDSKVIHLTYKEFTQKVWDFTKNPDTFVYAGKLPCVVDFYADWCGPCRKVSPIMETMAKEYDGKLIIYKVNVDKEPNLAAAFQVTSIPMVLFIPMKGQPMKQVGALNEQQYKQIIEQNLLKVK